MLIYVIRLLSICTALHLCIALPPRAPAAACCVESVICAWHGMRPATRSQPPSSPPPPRNSIRTRQLFSTLFNWEPRKKRHVKMSKCDCLLREIPILIFVWKNRKALRFQSSTGNKIGKDSLFFSIPIERAQFFPCMTFLMGGKLF